MPRLQTIVPLIAIALLLLLPACAPPLKTAAWVVRFDLDSPKEAAAVCADARQAGFDELLVQVRGRADAHYRSKIAPRALNLATAPADYDPLAVLLTECAPLPLHAWLNVYYLWGGAAPPENPEHPGHPKQPWILSDNNGKPVSLYSPREKRLGWIEGTYADPASPEYRALFVEVVRELLARYQVAGIHLDFVRYPGPGYGKSEAAAGEFKRLFGLDPRLLPDRIEPDTLREWLDGRQAKGDRVLTTAALFWNEFRAGQVSLLVSEIRAAIRASNAPDARLSAAVFPDPAAAYLENGQEWQAWAAEGLIDALYPMAYSGDQERVEAQLKNVGAHTPKTQGLALWAGLGPSGKSPAQIKEEARTAGLLGYEGIALFSLGHLQKNPPIQAWQEAARAGKPTEAATVAPYPNKTLGAAPAALAPPSLSGLKNIVTKALTGTMPGRDLDDRLEARFAEYEQARNGAIPQAIHRLSTKTINLPERLEMTGIFRYAHPLDSPTRKKDQEVLCKKARERLLSGEEAATVAKDISQDTTRAMGGLLAPRLVDPLNPQDLELAGLKPGEISRVMQVADGFWCYRLEGRDPGGKSTFSAAPWEARRILFRRELNEISAASVLQYSWRHNFHFHSLHFLGCNLMYTMMSRTEKTSTPTMA